jgi:hypothetical protein
MGAHPRTGAGYLSGGPPAASCPNGYAIRALVVVFDKGAFDPSKMKSPRPVDVNGIPGLQADVVPINDVVKWTVAVITDLKHLPLLSTVAWQYAPNSWAVAAWRNNTDPQAESSALAIARAVRTGARHPALAPFAVTYLPVRWTVVSCSKPTTSWDIHALCSPTPDPVDWHLSTTGRRTLPCPFRSGPPK